MPDIDHSLVSGMIVEQRRHKCESCETIYYTIESIQKEEYFEDNIKVTKETVGKEYMGHNKPKLGVSLSQKIIQKESMSFIEDFASNLIVSKEPVSGDKIYYRLIYECKNNLLELSKHKLFRVLRANGVKEGKINGVLHFYIKLN